MLYGKIFDRLREMPLALLTHFDHDTGIGFYTTSSLVLLTNSIMDERLAVVRYHESDVIALRFMEPTSITYSVFEWSLSSWKTRKSSYSIVYIIGLAVKLARSSLKH